MKHSEKNQVIVRILNNAGAANLSAFAVDPGGKIVEMAPFQENEARLETSRDVLSDHKIYIAQAMPEALAQKASERTLLKAKAYEAVKIFSGKYIDIHKIPDALLQPWRWNNCLITGHVNKNFNIDGQTKNLPICNARVHICEVETELVFPYIPIYKRPIPDPIIYEIGRKFKQIQFKPKPIPDPIGPVSIHPNNSPIRSLMAAKKLPQSAKMKSLHPLPDDVVSAMTSGSLETIRQTLYDFHDILYPYICLWDVFWPWFYSCDEETIVYTDCNGHFEMWENTLTEDGALNVYVWVEVNINGQWVTVYKPPIPCYTWWDYACFTDININITDARVLPCNCDRQVKGEIVWFRSIGESATALHIQQNDSNVVGVQGANMRNVGCTDIIDPLQISPFGDVLNFKMLFGDGLPTAGITHYRWKKTRVKDENLNNIPMPVSSVISGLIQKNYFVITIQNGQSHFETRSVTLGADGTGENIGYKIPHWDIYAEPLVPAADKLLTIQWTSPDFWGASIDTHSLANGLFRFDLELLTLDGSGVFQVVSVPKQVFQVSDYNNSGDSVNAPDYDLNTDGGNPANAFNLSFKARIDNAHCAAHIHNVMLADSGGSIILDGGGNPIESGKCGFIRYTNLNQQARLSFEASHPRNFATFSYNVIKGNNAEATGVNPSGYVVSSIGGFTLSGGVFSNNVPVTQLLGTCPGQAAFSENLYVAALATNGTVRLDAGYDASDVNAFALSNT